MTDRELLWLEGINRLQMTMVKVLVDSPSQQTPATLRSLGEQLRGCTQDLAQLGSTTERLQPVYQLAKRGCAQYDEAAQCFDTVASITDTTLTAGSGEEQKLTQAINCGSAAVGNGGTLLADAEVTGFNIKQAAG